MLWKAIKQKSALGNESPSDAAARKEANKVSKKLARAKRKLAKIEQQVEAADASQQDPTQQVADAKANCCFCFARVD